jgi:hypothetical protein
LTAPDSWHELFAMSASTKRITRKTTAQGFWWRYRHSEYDPSDTLHSAIMIAAKVAADEAHKSGKSYVVASTRKPSPAVYVFASDHPDASNAGISIMYQLTPAGECIHHRPPRHQHSVAMGAVRPI